MGWRGISQKMAAEIGKKRQVDKWQEGLVRWIDGFRHLNKDF